MRGCMRVFILFVVLAFTEKMGHVNSKIYREQKCIKLIMAKMNKCFIIMPVSTPENWLPKYSGDKDHFIHVLDHLLIPSVKKAGFEPIPPIIKGSELIHSEIIENIESTDLVLCDMSILNPNVFFELGIRTSLNKPVCIIKDDVTNNIPFDIAIINNHTYLSALNPWTIDKQIEDLTDHIKESYNKCEGSNSLWKYFSLSSTAKPIEGEHDIEGKIEFLTKQIEALRNQLDRSNEKSRSYSFLYNEFSKIASSHGASISGMNMEGSRVTLNLSKWDADLEAKLAGRASNFGYKLECFWSST